MQYSTVQYRTVPYSTVQYSAVQYSTVQHSRVKGKLNMWYSGGMEDKGDEKTTTIEQ